MARTFEKGEAIRAQGREWTVAIPPEGDVDLLIADPHFTDEERARMQRTDKVNDRRGLSIPYDVGLQRTVLDLSEIES